MCLEFGSCFGGRRRDDYGRSRGNHGHSYWSTPANQQPPTVAVHDGPPKAGHADAGGNGGYADWQDKAGGETPWHNKVGDDAGYCGAYTPRVHEAAADPREHATSMDYQYHQYPTTTTTTTTLARYQVASR